MNKKNKWPQKWHTQTHRYTRGYTLEKPKIYYNIVLMMMMIILFFMFCVYTLYEMRGKHFPQIINFAYSSKTYAETFVYYWSPLCMYVSR